MITYSLRLKIVCIDSCGLFCIAGLYGSRQGRASLTRNNGCGMNNVHCIMYSMLIVIVWLMSSFYCLVEGDE